MRHKKSNKGRPIRRILKQVRLNHQASRPLVLLQKVAHKLLWNQKIKLVIEVSKELCGIVRVICISIDWHSPVDIGVDWLLSRFCSYSLRCFYHIFLWGQHQENWTHHQVDQSLKNSLSGVGLELEIIFLGLEKGYCYLHQQQHSKQWHMTYCSN